MVECPGEGRECKSVAKPGVLAMGVVEDRARQCELVGDHTPCIALLARGWIEGVSTPKDVDTLLRTPHEEVWTLATKAKLDSKGTQMLRAAKKMGRGS